MRYLDFTLKERDTVEFVLSRVAVASGSNPVGYCREGLVVVCERETLAEYSEEKAKKMFSWTCAIKLPRAGGEIWLGGAPQINRDFLEICEQAIINAQRYRAAQEGAAIDELTKLPNKAALKQRICEEISRCSRYRRASFCVAFLDFDNFKAINDAFGHLAGDEALQETADVLRRSVRKSDVVARFGGDEFVILLQEVRLEHAQRVVERITGEIERLKVRGVSPAVSVGLAAYPEDGEDVERLLTVADTRMYEVKRSKKGGLSRETVVNTGHSC